MGLSTQNRVKASFKAKRSKLLNKYSSKSNYKDACSDVDSDRSQSINDSSGKMSKNSNLNNKKNLNKQIQHISKKYSNISADNDKFASNTIKRKYMNSNAEKIHNNAENITDEDLILKRLKINNKNLIETKNNYEQCNMSIQNLKNQLKQLDDESANPELNNVMVQLEEDYYDRIQLIDAWFDNKKYEIEKKFDAEVKVALNEFNEKSKELKDNLKSEYEDKRKLIEIEKSVLDINVDTNEIKPTVTRKLRRRGNFNDSGQSFVVSSYISSTNTAAALSSSSSTQIINSTQSTSIFSISTNAILVSNNSSERKRRPSPSNQLSYPLNEEEISDDVKYLFKNLNSYPHKFINESINISNICTD